MSGDLNCYGQRAGDADCLFLHTTISPIAFDHVMTSYYVEAPPMER